MPCRSTGYDGFLKRGAIALADQSPKPNHVWNRIPDDVRGKVIKLALEATELSPRELAVRFTDTESYFVLEASLYRLLKAHDLVTSPACIVIKAAGAFKDKTTAINQLLLSGMMTCPAGQWADGLYLAEGYWLGLVLSLNHPGRLFPLYHLVEAVQEHESRRRDGHAGLGFTSIRMRFRPTSSTSRACSAR